MTHYYNTMDKTIKQYGATFVLDTNVVIRACNDRQFAQRVRWCMGASTSEIVINSKVESELMRHGLSMKIIPAILKDRLQVDDIIYDAISRDEHQDAKWLEEKNETLHRGDSDILAFAYVRGLVLLTCDKGLVKAARDVNVKCINPDTKGRNKIL